MNDQEVREKFKGLVHDHMQQTGQGKIPAAMKIARKNPELHTAYLKATQPAASRGQLGTTASNRELTEEEKDTLRRFNEKVSAKMKGGMTRAQAVAAVAKADKKLHRAYLLATNPRVPADLLDAKCDLS